MTRSSSLAMRFHSVEQRYVKGYRFLSFSRNLFDKYGKTLLHTATKTGADAEKKLLSKIVHKAAKTTGELIKNKAADKIVEFRCSHLNFRYHAYFEKRVP